MNGMVIVEDDSTGGLSSEELLVWGARVEMHTHWHELTFGPVDDGSLKNLSRAQLEQMSLDADEDLRCYQLTHRPSRSEGYLRWDYRMAFKALGDHIDELTLRLGR